MQFQQVGSLSFVWTEGPRVKLKIKKERNKERKRKEKRKIVVSTKLRLVQANSYKPLYWCHI